MRAAILTCICVSLLGMTLPVARAERHTAATLWLTDADRSALLAEQPAKLKLQKIKNAEPPTIAVDDTHMLQPADGFGFALTGGSAQLLMRMDVARRQALLQELFGDGAGGIHVSYLRVSIGSSDMNDHIYTYDDMPQGQTDPSLAHFSLHEDEADVIPVMQAILKISPKMKILASPWSAPSWMKTNDDPKGGSLRPEFYPTYAQYLVKYIQSMQAHGIRIDAITPQNEPLNPKNTPSMVMQAGEQATFIKQALGPAWRANSIQTKIIIYDHNCDRPDYALAVLNDPEARQYIDGSGFHLYAGGISAMTQVHDAFPAKNLYFTEQMVIDNQHGQRQPVARPVARVVIGAMRNWSRNVLLWNLAADPNNGPHTSNGGCPICQGAITLDGDSVQRNNAYYTIAHVSKFVPPGSVHIPSTEPDSTLSNVAFHTVDGHTVLLVANTGEKPRTFTVGWHKRVFTAMLGVDSIGTFVW